MSKKHWVNFTAEISGSVLVEGDETAEDAFRYVARHLDVRGDVEGVDAGIEISDIELDEAHEEKNESDNESHSERENI